MRVCACKQGQSLFGNIFLCIEKARGVAAAIFGENSVRVKMVLDRFGIIAGDRVLSGSFSSHSKGGGRPESVQKVIRYVYYDLSSVHLKGFWVLYVSYRPLGI